MNKEHQIVAIRLAKLLSQYYQYDIASIDNLGDITLNQPFHPHYPVIHIRLSPLDSKPDLSKSIVDSINAMNRVKRDLKLLTFSFVDPSQSTQTHEIVYVDAQMNDPFIKIHYPKIKQVKWAINDPNLDLKLAVNDLNQQSLQNRNKKVRGNLLKNSKGALTIIGICILVYLLGLWISSLAQYNSTYMITLGGIYVPFIQGGLEVWRFLAAGFVHASMTHLFVNMLSLYNISVFLEKAYGTKKFIITLLLSILGGNLLVYVAEHDAAISVGLSTGIYGLMGLLLVYLFESKLINNNAIRQQILFIFGINLVINFLPNISWLGHLGGFVTGVLVGLIMSKRADWQSLKQHTLIASLLVVLMLGYFGINRVKPKKLFLASDRDSISVLRKLNLGFYADYLENRMIKYYSDYQIGE